MKTHADAVANMRSQEGNAVAFEFLARGVVQVPCRASWFGDGDRSCLRSSHDCEDLRLYGGGTAYHASPCDIAADATRQPRAKVGPPKRLVGKRCALRLWVT